MEQADIQHSGTHFVFDPVAVHYDRCNHIFSLGIDHYWRKKLVKTACAHSSQSVLDICTGTGDVIFSFLKHSRVQQISGVDMSEFMIDLAQEKQIRYSSKAWIQHKHISWKVGDAINTGLDTEGYDIVSCAFGIRNISDRTGALNEMHRLLRPKGKLYILEFSLPGNPILRFAYTMYLCHVMPFFGKIVVGTKDAIKYLAKSIRHWHMNIDFADELDRAGFRLLYKTPLSGGVVTLWVVVKK